MDIFETGIINRVANHFTKRCQVSRVMYTECVDEGARIDQLLRVYTCITFYGHTIRFVIL